jgi:hypothetical protein
MEEVSRGRVLDLLFLLQIQIILSKFQLTFITSNSSTDKVQVGKEKVTKKGS